MVASRVCCVPQPISPLMFGLIAIGGRPSPVNQPRKELVHPGTGRGSAAPLAIPFGLLWLISPLGVAPQHLPRSLRTLTCDRLLLSDVFVPLGFRSESCRSVLVWAALTRVLAGAPVGCWGPKVVDVDSNSGEDAESVNSGEDARTNLGASKIPGTM